MPFFSKCVKICRAKWKKRKKTNNVFRSATTLLPPHTLSPFGSMNSNADSLCTFGSTPDSRWALSGTGMGQVSSHSLSLGHTLGRQAPSFGQGGGLNCNLNQNAISPPCHTPYPCGPYNTASSLNCSPPTANQADGSPGTVSCSPQTGWLCSASDTSAWRGSSIATLRRKALEHSVMTIR